jgi:hypothetical protein
MCTGTDADNLSKRAPPAEQTTPAPAGRAPVILHFKHIIGSF